MNTLYSTISDVRQFHQKFELAIPRKVTELSTTEGCVERLRHLREELHELGDAIDAQDVVKQVDALVDLQYLILGTAVSMGLTDAQWEDAFLAVHFANMRKVRVIGDDTAHKQGISKPDDWSPPDILKAIGLRGGQL